MSDDDPVGKPGPTFRDWCLARAKKWQDEADSRDRPQPVNFCLSERDKYMRALEKARKGFVR